MQRHVREPFWRDMASIWEAEGLDGLASECGLLEPGAQSSPEDVMLNLCSSILGRVGKLNPGYPHPWSDERAASFKRPKRTKINDTQSNTFGGSDTMGGSCSGSCGSKSSGNSNGSGGGSYGGRSDYGNVNANMLTAPLYRSKPSLVNFEHGGLWQGEGQVDVPKTCLKTDDACMFPFPFRNNQPFLPFNPSIWNDQARPGNSRGKNIDFPGDSGFVPFNTNHQQNYGEISSNRHGNERSRAGGNSGRKRRARCQISSRENGWSARRLTEGGDSSDGWESSGSHGGSSSDGGFDTSTFNNLPLEFGELSDGPFPFGPLSLTDEGPRRKANKTLADTTSMASSPLLDSLLGAADHVGAYSSSSTPVSSRQPGFDFSDDDSFLTAHPSEELIFPEVVESDEEERKRKKSHKSKQQKGLRYYSLKVCEKVEQQQRTTYNQVADELVNELSSNPDSAPGGKVYDEKNIRRRVYDAINVLVAIGVLTKERKDIRWGELPGANPELRRQEKEREALQQSIAKKRKRLNQLLTQLVSFKNLAARNSSSCSPFSASSVSSSSSPSPRLHLPFVVIHTNAVSVDCNMNDNRSKVKFKFSDRFVVEEEQDVLKGLGLARVSSWQLPALIPRELCHLYPRDFVDDRPR